MAFGRRHLAPKHRLGSARLHLPKTTQRIKAEEESLPVLVTLAYGSSFYAALCATLLPTVRAFLAPILSLTGTVTPLLVPTHPIATGKANLVLGWPLQKGHDGPRNRSGERPAFLPRSPTPIALRSAKERLFT